MATKKKSIYESKTPRWQRIAIWTIAIVMAGGTMITFVVSIFSSQNKQLDPATIAYNKQMSEYQKQLNSDENKAYLEQQEQAKAKLRGLDGFTDQVKAFTAADITALKVETLKQGDGATVAENAKISANYTGWLPDGTIFDSTKSEDSDAKPASFSLSQVITGWSKGLVGTRAGGVYLLSIPSADAYGENGSGTSIPANTPLKFIVQIVSAS